jgi:hypothetical protein
LQPIGASARSVCCRERFQARDAIAYAAPEICITGSAMRGVSIAESAG